MSLCQYVNMPGCQYVKMRLFSFNIGIKTKVVQNVIRMLDSHCVIMTKCQYVNFSICQYVSKFIINCLCQYVIILCQYATFQLRYQNESCSECHQEKVVKECENVRVRE